MIGRKSAGHWVCVCSIVVGLALAAHAQPVEHLLFWNKLGSTDEVLNPPVGPAPMIEGTVSFVPGMFGHAYAAVGHWYISNRIVIPASGLQLSPQAGTVEAWVMYPRDPIVWAYQYGMFSMLDGPYQEGYDQTLGGQVHHYIGDGVTGDQYTLYVDVNFGSQVSLTISGVNGIFHPGEWHHLAIVWDKAGIGNSSDGVRVYFDGLIHGANASNAWGDTPDVGNRHTIGKGEGFDDGTPAFVIDNIRVWDIAKTDFSDRFVESPLPPAAELELVAEVPPTAGIIVEYVDALHALAEAPNEIVFATRNVGAYCGGGTPASAWKLALDAFTGEALTLVLKQSLSEIENVRQSILEASDGTLLTGGGWCLHKPPYVSLDGGESWRAASVGVHPPNSTFSLAEFQGSVYAGTGYDPYPAQIYRWLGGSGPDDWQLVWEFAPPRTIVGDLAVWENRLFVGLIPYPCVGCEGGVSAYVSDDGNNYGPTVGLPACHSVNRLLVVGAELIAFTVDCQLPNDSYVYRWDGDLDEWVLVASFPLGWSNARPMAHAGRVYAYGQKPGDPARGIYRSTDLGVTWERVVELTNPDASAFHVHDDTLYIGTYRDASDTARICRLRLIGPIIGDLNCDGRLSFGDINPFVLAMTNWGRYLRLYPDCDIYLADINRDGYVDFDDINLFVALLSR